MDSRWLVALIALVSFLPLVAGQNVPPQMLPQTGPDVPASPLPAATVEVFVADLWAWTEGLRQREFTVPVPPSGGGAWDRIVLEVRINPVGDPWDRLFMATIGPAEVLHGTTPRTDMTVRREITEYATLLPPGENATAGLYLGSWEGGGLLAWVTLEFHEDPTGLAVHRADYVAAPFRIHGLCGGPPRTATVTFPDEIPDSAVVELYTSGHGDAEFWYMSSVAFPRNFEVYVDGTLVGVARAMPYVYALLGFRGTEGALHGPMWWTAQQGLDVAGVHTGVGEIPPYHLQIDDETLPLLTGNRTVTLRQTWAECVWMTSVNFLLG